MSNPPPVSPPIVDDESDLLEINLNQRTLRSKTESELSNSNEPRTSALIPNGLESSSSSSAIQEMSMNKQRTKQLRDQTTNTPPMSRLTSSIKGKKKVKKKSASPVNSASPDAAATINSPNTHPPSYPSPVPTTTKLQKVKSLFPFFSSIID